MEQKTLERHKLPSGAVLVVGMPSFEAADELMNAFMGQAAKTGEKPDMRRSALLSVVASPVIKSAIFLCAEKTRWAPFGDEGFVPVNKQLFDDPEYGERARKDFVEILLTVLGVTMRPFFESAFSESTAEAAKVGG